jgi:hypothetical protein
MTAAPAHRTNFHPNPLQKNFIESRAKASLFSSRMGEGKSTALAWSALYHTRHNPGASWALIRDTFENIVGTTQKTFFQWFPPGIYGEYNASKKVFTWASGVAQGDVTFMGMDDQQDASKLMSREFAGFGIDEPAPAVGSAGVDEMIFDIALSRLRQPGMKWYCGKLAENNPDEAHWTYKRFVADRDPDFEIWQPATPENLLHLPAGYYSELRRIWSHRPDLIRRFVDGEFGFQSIGRAVTPQWNDKLHLALGLAPLPRQEVFMLWDFGLNPTCIMTQRSPLGHWLILDAMSAEESGVEELIDNWAAPLWNDRYKRLSCTIRHYGDPAGTTREQSSSMRSAVRSLKQKLPGPWRAGPVKPEERIEPLRAVLTRTVGGQGLVRVDRERAACVWHALRGGWHHHISRAGLVSGVPVKDKHSHPGDAMGYGAALLFPLGRKPLPAIPGQGIAKGGTPGYFSRGTVARPEEALFRIGKPVSGGQVPRHGAPLSAPR